MWGEKMTAQCGICEFHGRLEDAPLFVCFNCGDAIRRLVWIHEQELNYVPSEAPEPILESATTIKPKSAVLGKR